MPSLRLMSPSLGIYVTTPAAPSSGRWGTKWRRGHKTKSAPAAHTQYRRQRKDFSSNTNVHGHQALQKPAGSSAIGTGPTLSPGGLGIHDIIDFVERTREMSSLENRRHVMEEVQRAVHHEPWTMNFSPSRQAASSNIAFSDKEPNRHPNTPADDEGYRLCCDIMDSNVCQTCRKLKHRLLNQRKPEIKDMSLSVWHQNISMVQTVKRFYPCLTEIDIQEMINRGDIAQNRFSIAHRDRRQDRYSRSDEIKADFVCEQNGFGKTVPVSESARSTLLSTNPIYLLAKLSIKFKGKPTTPLFFSNLKKMQDKILSGEVQKNSYMNKQKPDMCTFKSVVSPSLMANAGKSHLSNFGVKLHASLMPTFVSPRKIEVIKNPKCKSDLEPPLLEKRKQIPNPSFFAGSRDEYSLPERLPDILEFTDAKMIE